MLRKCFTLLEQWLLKRFFFVFVSDFYSHMKIKLSENLKYKRYQKIKGLMQVLCKYRNTNKNKSGFNFSFNSKPNGHMVVLTLN